MFQPAQRYTASLFLRNEHGLPRGVPKCGELVIHRIVLPRWSDTIYMGLLQGYRGGAAAVHQRIAFLQKASKTPRAA